MNTMERKNIDNLVSIWELVGNQFEAYKDSEEYACVFIENSNWPNRLWFKERITKTGIENVENQLKKVGAPMILPFWDLYDIIPSDFFDKKGYTIAFEQIAMYYTLGNQFTDTIGVTLHKVQTEEEASQWAIAFESSFGYQIMTEIVYKTSDKIAYYVVKENKRVVGTVLLHNTEDVMGIHSLGILPEERKKGYADQIMKKSLNIAQDQGCKHAVLQASSMGRSLYLRLGFKEQFLIKNYESLKR
ncbi:GNAT family N-acetyltransferase [Aquimarina hainanensis]|uniref:GNAT family N-acetyltransferase n=1 Tax=Aquimarina hainanensis TaxID=1578017 RepID=A0ABW5N9Z8_9FLAO|nr:GNAT family N-acetyltransferase [Aquimarina sp. TRL1]QKX05494.1 GNAT family N-acetyltransferase [Aquimarina sp. TRL1]